jgi:hypothetical protein
MVGERNRTGDFDGFTPFQPSEYKKSGFWYGICVHVCVYRILVGKPEGKRPLGRSRRRW